MKKIALYNPYLETKGGGEKVCLALAQSLQQDLDCQVYLVSHSAIDLDDLAHYFKLNLNGIKILQVDFDTFVMRLVRRLPLPGRFKNIISDFKVARTIKRGDFDVFINNCYQSNLPSPAKLGVYMCMFPQRLDTKTLDASVLKQMYVLVARGLHRLVLHPAQKSPLDTYKLITANSAYTQSYIKKLWDKESEIVFPICENMLTQPRLKKEKIILHVGRFFENSGESHHKKQDAMLECFSKMKKLHEEGWELHFAGSVAEDVGALKYILQLIKDSQGLPVFFHFNSSFSELQKLFNQASIYWHATGYGSSLEKHPEKQEHFGITTVEAMSAGCVPIVINAAGQKESVVQGKNGFLWDTLDELSDYTYTVAELPAEGFQKLSKAAQQDAKRFDTAAFRENVRAVFDKIIS